MVKGNQLQIIPTNTTFVNGGNNTLTENTENAQSIQLPVSIACLASETPVLHYQPLVGSAIKDETELSEVIGDLVISEAGFRSMNSPVWFDYSSSVSIYSYIADLLQRGNDRLRRCLYEGIFSSQIFKVACNHFLGNQVILLMVSRSRTSLEQQYIVTALSGQMVELSCARYATRIVQEVLQKFDMPTCGGLISELKQNAHMLITHNYGSHVFEVIFGRMRPLNYGFIIDEITETNAITGNVVCDKHGCRILEISIQVLVSEVRQWDSSVAAEFLKKLIDCIVDICDVDVVANEYGNFVVQRIIAIQYLSEFADRIIKNAISGNVLVLSQKKHGSHVIQTALRYATPKSLYLMMCEIFDGYDIDRSGKDALDVLMLDVYGNYVVQTMLGVAIDVKDGKRDGLVEWFERLAGRLLRARSTIINYSSGKKLIGTLNEILLASVNENSPELQMLATVNNNNPRMLRNV
ncbi:unnamed protein product [Anisakis simplex]|uniref:PUM-HD domain-containing protein n=1 Tax=Anisakis simplex TaxID=6269 RepID=A0A0M3K846_ANISI|nr:unnamed protein product [Anisakis simplex]